MRIALLTLAVPLKSRPSIGLYNIDQAAALTKLGHQTEVFTIAPKIPQWTRWLGERCRRQVDRPTRRVESGVPVNTVRAFAAYPKVVRQGVARRAPGAVARWFSYAIEGPLGKALDRFEPEALIVHGMMPWGAIGARLARRHGCPIVVMEHSADDVTAATQYDALGKQYARLAHCVDRIFCVSQGLTDSLISIGVENTQTLRNGVNTRPVGESMEAPDRDSIFSVLCAGEFHERKGHAILLEGFARARLGSAVLRIVGEPPTWLRAKIARFGLNDRVEFLPLMPNRDLLHEMARADVFALPSWSEAFGLVFLEALGAGTPIVATSDCGAAEHLVHGRHGWIIPPRDAMACTVALETARTVGPQRRSDMGRWGRELVTRQFSWSTNAAEVVRGLSRSFGNSVA